MDDFEMQSSSKVTMSSSKSFILNAICRMEALLKKPQIDEELNDVSWCECITRLTSISMALFRFLNDLLRR